MWPGCPTCGAPLPTMESQYCGGNRCAGKGNVSQRQIVRLDSHRRGTKKKITRAMIQARRKKGRRK